MNKQTTENLIQSFYEAFAKRDSQAMIECYHKDAVFSDPVFLELKGSEIGAMWSMLCLQAKTLEIQSSHIHGDNEQGQARWTARYEFGKPPRPVFNQIRARFKFKEGKIISHNDYFSLWKWSRMALGPLGLVLGWHGKVQARIRKQAMSNLKKFITDTNYS